jgi:hypothetical protein
LIIDLYLHEDFETTIHQVHTLDLNSNSLGFDDAAKLSNRRVSVLLHVFAHTLQ